MLKSIPNTITVLRTLASLVAPLLILYGDGSSGGGFNDGGARLAALALFILAAATDWLDGMLARRLEAQSNFGRMLDPIADKLLLIGCLLALVARDDRMRDTWGAVFFLPVLLIVLREVLVSGLREYVATHKITLHVTWVAKIKTVMQMIAVGFVIGLPVVPPIITAVIPAAVIFTNLAEYATIALLWIACAFTLISGWEYFSKALRHDIFS